jgi:hypothetical protein
MMTNIPLGAKVHCLDQACGESIAVLVDPANQKVTHLVLQDNSLAPEHTRVVPLEQVKDSTPKEIDLACNRETVQGLDPFEVTRTTQVERPMPPAGGADTFTSMPSETTTVESREEVIPEGEIVLHRGSKVEATDGSVGQVDAIYVRPENGEIRNVVTEEGFIWNKKVVMLPRQAIDHMTDNTVYLNIDKHSVHTLPETPLQQYLNNPTVVDDEERTDPGKTDPQAQAPSSSAEEGPNRTGADFESDASSRGEYRWNTDLDDIEEQNRGSGSGEERKGGGQ